MSERKKENRLRFTLNNSSAEDAKAIESYYEEPIGKILLEPVIKLIKEKAASLPADYRKKIA